MRRKSILLSGVIGYLALGLLASLTLTQPLLAADPDSSQQTHPERLKARTPWETIAYLPGAVVYFPVKMGFSGISYTVGWVYDTKVIERVEDLFTSDDELRGLQPTYSARTGGGGNLYQRGLLNGFSARVKDQLTATAAFGDEHRQYYQLHWTDIALPVDGTSLDLNARRRLFPEENFFGLGPSSHHSDKSHFGHELTRLHAVVKHTLGNTFTLDLGAGTDWNRVREGGRDDIGEEDEEPSTTDLYNEDSLPGISIPATLGSIEAGLQVDRRNRPGNPTRGVYGGLRMGYSADLEGSRWGFTTTEADLSVVQHIAYGRVIVLRAAAEVNRAVPDGRLIPFYELAELGEDNTIRGFERNRFLGRDKALGSIEYRFPLRNIWDESGIDFTLFVDGGQVSNRGFFEDARLADTHIGGGGGLRFWNLNGVVARVEVARSRDLWRLYVVLN